MVAPTKFIEDRNGANNKKRGWNVIRSSLRSGTYDRRSFACNADDENEIVHNRSFMEDEDNGPDPIEALEVANGIVQSFTNHQISNRDTVQENQLLQSERRILSSNDSLLGMKDNSLDQEYIPKVNEVSQLISEPNSHEQGTKPENKPSKRGTKIHCESKPKLYDRSSDEHHDKSHDGLDGDPVQYNKKSEMTNDNNGRVQTDVDKRGRRETMKNDLQKKKFIILPQSTFRTYWDIYISVLLLYVGSFVPYRISFLGELKGFLKYCEIFVDTSFAIGELRI